METLQEQLGERRELRLEVRVDHFGHLLDDEEAHLASVGHLSRHGTSVDEVKQVRPSRQAVGGVRLPGDGRNDAHHTLAHKALALRLEAREHGGLDSGLGCGIQLGPVG